MTPRTDPPAAPRAQPPLFEASGLCVARAGRRVLRGLSFRVHPGEWIGLAGPNGSGKTTLLRTLSGVQPYEGSLRFQGTEVRGWKAGRLARQLAFVQQIPAPAFDFTVEELVLLGRLPHKGWLEPYTADDRVRVREALDEVDLSGLAGRAVPTLSGGERQRAFLAQALVQDAGLLVLDEPTAHLDVHHQFSLLERVRALAARGRTIVTVFHDLELAARYASRLLVLSDGELVADGAPAALLTPALLRDVFRMDAEIETDRSGTLRIRYARPAAP